VHHVGRRSGTTYETPVVPVRTEDGFVVALPYGPTADWVQNVLAAGRATITHEDETYEVDRPEVVPTEQVGHHFDDSTQKTHRAFRVDECLRLHDVAGV
jgi:deazaflavin-dependent oxidoreductase (nitroreductase family)